ncbi:hypothetical protein EJ06DRAFT_484456 [Trichodelitschia bisporula]|uniref:Glyoxalase/fosfomycin resistance/dioxygenase domain-containing protein n=1 Tax=Trichodelitschia bisporula TaxID=703511 RepID=A0A6G1HIE5_9PEZI|nr:hypothetical protein EJ06DRAFT_484456 [Trichodelitschia bisporula]
MSLDHFSIVVPAPAFEPLIAFLLKSVGHLGLKEIIRPVPQVVGLGVTRPYFWIAISQDDEAAVTTSLKKQHIAFTAETVEEIKTFYEVALKEGATDNGAPGPRNYTPGYYAAFVKDPVAGINFEVCMKTYKGE